MAESSFQKGFGGGCGLVLGILFALLLIPLLVVVSCTASLGGCLLVGPAVQKAQEAADRARRQEQQEASKTVSDSELAEPVVSADLSASSPQNVSIESTESELEPVQPDSPAQIAPKDQMDQELRPSPQEDHPENRTPPRLGETFRIWTDQTGQYRIEAEFVSLTMGQVKLRKRDGTEITVQKERLSEADRDWLRRRAR